MKGLIIPKTFIHNFSEYSVPLIFLFGPIKGAGGWRNRAIDIIEDLGFDGFVASPDAHPDEKYNSKLVYKGVDFSTNLEWERYYWEKSLYHGAGMFWLPKLVDFNINQIYARETRGEQGEVRGMLRFEPNLRVVIGGEEGFEGLSLMKRNYLEVRPSMKFYVTLEETCAEVVRLAREPRLNK